MFVVWRCSYNRFLSLSIPGSEQLLINIYVLFWVQSWRKPQHLKLKNRQTKLHETAVHINFTPDGLFCIQFSSHVDIQLYIRYYGATFYVCTSGLCSLWRGFHEIEVHDIEVRFHTFYCYFGRAEENCSLYPGLCYYRGLLNWSSTVTRLLIGGLNCTVLYCNFQLLTRDMDLHGWLGAVKQPNKFDNIQPQNDHSISIWSVQSSCPATGRINIVKIK